MANWKEVDKDLVAEQPGLGLSLIGLFLAFFMGITVRATLSPDRVQEQLHHATEHIHRDLDIKFKNAYVSFARGIWPDLSVVIKDVTIQSNKSCYFTPLAEINEIRLPLSFKHLFQGQILIHEILADEVNLSLRSEYSKCEEVAAAIDESNFTVSMGPAGENRNPANQASEEREGKSSKPPVLGKFENVSRKNPIDTVQIANLKIHYLPVAFTSIHIQDFQALLRAEDPRWIELTGKLNLEPDSFTGDTSSLANIQIDSVEGPDPSLQVLIHGGWREGQYRVAANLDPKTQVLEFESSAHHLPLSQIIPILKKYRWVESEFDGRRAWISGNIKIKGALSELRKTPAKLTGFKLEGELGEVACNQADILSWEPLEFKPIDFEIRALKIKEFLTFLNRSHPSPALGNLGLFSGTAHFISPEQLALRGDYSGLEFIFSNRGNRQIQTLSLVSGELELKKNQWHIQLDRVKPAEGIFEGKVTMLADKDFKDLSIDAKLTELTLSPQVQNLMTGGGRIGPASGELKIHLKKAEIADLKGQIRWDQLHVEGLSISKPKLVLQTLGPEIQMYLSAQDLEFQRNNSFAGQIFNPVFESLKENQVILKSPQGLIRTQKFISLAWEKFQAQSSVGAIRSQGNWNEAGELTGELAVASKKPLMWNIQGTRNQPQLILRDL